jgi:hypothetical protein
MWNINIPDMIHSCIGSLDMSMKTFARTTPSVENQCAEQPVQGTPARRQPDQLLLGCIDAVLTELLGGKVREAIYDYLARQSSLAKEEIPEHLDEFCELLVKTLGRGAATLERRIASRLYDSLSLEFVDVPHLSLNEHVARIRSIIDRDLGVGLR